MNRGTATTGESSAVGRVGVPADAAPGDEVALYRAPNGDLDLRIRLDGETVWLTLGQMATLFAVRKPAVSKHLSSIYASGELQRQATVSKMETVQDEGGRTIRRQTEFYSLDSVLSVGYRVNSAQATQFRIWATRVLREHLLRGYTVNQRRLQELNQVVRLVAAITERRALTGDEATALLRVVADYSYALDLLDDYDTNGYGRPGRRPQPPCPSPMTRPGASWSTCAVSARRATSSAGRRTAACGVRWTGSCVLPMDCGGRGTRAGRRRRFG